MNLNQIIYIVLVLTIVVCGFIFIGLVFYIGRKKIKEIDRIVLGKEVPKDSDSIFYKGMRLMNYGGAFAWRLGAKRSKLLHLRDHFDKNFQLPFKLFFLLGIVGACLIVLLFLLDKFLLHVT